MTEQVAVDSSSVAGVVADDPLINMIQRVALDPDSDLDKLERMMAMKERHDQKVAKAQFDAAFAQASAEFPDIPLNGLNKHNGTRYAELRDILGGTKSVLSRYGLALSFSTEVNDKEVIVTAELSHRCGHTKTNSLPLPKDTGAGRNAVQAVGSSQTYGQRYTAQAILGLSLGEDGEDDGESSGPKPLPGNGPKTASWAETITQELPPNATNREKAEAIAAAICAQFRRKNGERALDNEWDRRAKLIDALEENYKDLYSTVEDAYNNRRNEITGAV